MKNTKSRVAERKKTHESKTKNLKIMRIILQVPPINPCPYLRIISRYIDNPAIVLFLLILVPAVGAIIYFPKLFKKPNLKLQKRINIENARAFKLEYYEGGSELKSKEFKTYKAMEQFHGRQTDFMYLDCNRYALIDDNWHRFIKLRSPIIFQEEVDFINKTFNDIVEAENLQKFKNEE